MVEVDQEDVHCLDIQMVNFLIAFLHCDVGVVLVEALEGSLLKSLLIIAKLRSFFYAIYFTYSIKNCK